MDNLQRNIWQNVKTHQYITWWMKASAEIGTWPGCVVPKNRATHIIGDKEWLVDCISTYGNICKFPTYMFHSTNIKDEEDTSGHFK